MLLVDYQIRARASSGMVLPFIDEHVNPASLDVTLGNTLLVETAESADLVPVDLGLYDQDWPYHLPPGGFCLAETRESFALPVDTCAQFVLKSSRAREGIDHLNAGWCDCGWGLSVDGEDRRSVLTMELKNVRQLHSVRLWPGMKIGQMKFVALDTPPLESYAIKGRYNGDMQVTSSKG